MTFESYYVFSAQYHKEQLGPILQQFKLQRNGGGLQLLNFITSNKDTIDLNIRFDAKPLNRSMSLNAYKNTS